MHLECFILAALRPTPEPADGPERLLWAALPHRGGEQSPDAPGRPAPAHRGDGPAFQRRRRGRRVGGGVQGLCHVLNGIPAEGDCQVSGVYRMLLRRECAVGVVLSFMKDNIFLPGAGKN